MRGKKQIARQQIRRALQLARRAMQEDQDSAQTYATLARRISRASRTPIPRLYRHRFCKACKHFILPGVNSHVRLRKRREPHVVVTCGHCGEHMRFPTRLKRKV
ncbi:MAG: ribonuclease P [Candidatus Bathyarchaeota archaeon]|nr:MAG: ribonuclease P [Candidatus Bathyarchaeota archaeon]